MIKAITQGNFLYFRNTYDWVILNINWPCKQFAILPNLEYSLIYFHSCFFFLSYFRFLHRKKMKMLILILTLFWNGVERKLRKKPTKWTVWENRTSDLSLWILNLKIRSTTLKAKISGTYILNSIYQKSYVVLKRSDHQF